MGKRVNRERGRSPGEPQWGRLEPTACGTDARPGRRVAGRGGG